MKTKNRTFLTLGGGLCALLVPYFFWVPQTIDISSEVENTRDSLSIGQDEYGFDRLLDTVNWLEEEDDPITLTINEQLFNATDIETWEEQANSIRLVKNEGQLWPLHPQQKVRLLLPHALKINDFLSYLSLQLPFREELYSKASFLQKIDCEEEETFVCMFDEKTFNEFKNDSSFLQKLNQLAILHPMLVVYFGHELPADFSNWPIAVLHMPHTGALAQAITAQALVGANDVLDENGTLVVSQRLGHVPAESVGMNPEKLQEMDRWIEKAIRRKVMPGCQVLVAKSGKIIYEKAFGYHTYTKGQAVDVDDVYDIASITKAAATTLGVMQLEEKGQLELAGRIRDYMPEYKRTSFSYLRVRHLLSHHTGLQGNLPIAQFLNRGDLFSDQPTDKYSVALDKNFYLKNDIRESLLAEVKKVKAPRRNFFRYSDVNFILLQQLVEHETGQSLDQYLRYSIYDPLGLQSLQYLPGLSLTKDQIVPTEKDQRWRKHTVHGEVHDESAVLLGGVAGHAGLFSNTRDLAILFQMLINKGTYGGEQFFESETVDQFISKNNYNYRAYGFDRLAGHSKNLRRYGASLKTFGHTGFTGTCVWADPENELVFIFLSNRIHPSKRNNKLQKTGLRERLHKIVYQSLSSGKAYQSKSNEKV